MHYAIDPGAHIGRTLRDIGKNKKEPFPSPIHLKGAMCCITMVKKRLSK
jgi:hypothetical protein